MRTKEEIIAVLEFGKFIFPEDERAYHAIITNMNTAVRRDENKAWVILTYFQTKICERLGLEFGQRKIMSGLVDHTLEWSE